MDYQVNDPELQRKLDLADNVIQPKTRRESRLQRYWQSVGWKHADKKTWDYHHPRRRTAKAVRLSFAELKTDFALDLFQLAAGQPLRFDGALGQRFLDQGRMDDLVVAGLDSFQFKRVC